jgi:hypothetical protein
MKIVPFEHNGKKYEVRIISDGNTVFIKTFLNGKPANGYRYSVELITAFELEQVMGYDGIRDLVEMAKSDVINGTWEKYLKVIKQ